MTPGLAISAILLLGGFVASLYLAPQVFRWWQVRGWRHAEGLMAITYDDGPDGTTTPQLLELLDELNVKATFYLVGFRAERVPEALALMADSGHELGAHSHLHLNAWHQPPWGDYADVERGYRTLASAMPADAPFRPPFGKVSFFTYVMLRLRGRRIDWWTRPTNDTDDEFPDPEALARQIVADREPVILLHSHHDEPHRRQFMLAVTRALVEEARRQSIRLVTMSELQSLTARAAS